jgi:hypothetical protein
VGLLQRLAHLQAHDRRDRLGLAEQGVVGVAQDVGALAGRQRGPARLCAVGGIEGRQRLVRAGLGDLPDGLAGAGILDLEAGPVAGVAPRAVDQELPGHRVECAAGRVLDGHARLLIAGGSPPLPARRRFRASG